MWNWPYHPKFVTYMLVLTMIRGNSVNLATISSLSLKAPKCFFVTCSLILSSRGLQNVHPMTGHRNITTACKWHMSQCRRRANWRPNLAPPQAGTGQPLLLEGGALCPVTTSPYPLLPADVAHVRYASIGFGSGSSGNSSSSLGRPSNGASRKSNRASIC